MIYLASDFDGLIIIKPHASFKAGVHGQSFWSRNSNLCISGQKVQKLNLPEHLEYLSTARRHFWHNSAAVFSVVLDFPEFKSIGNFVVKGNEEFVTLLRNDFV